MIEVVDLRVRSAARTLVDGVGFTVAEGRVLALVGASGSGKTTTGLALLGEHPPGTEVSGTIRVAGTWPAPPGTVGYIPQHPSSVLNPARRIGPVLRAIARLHGTRVPGALDAARLPADRAFLRRFPHQLSGGQQQRLVLAQALLTSPKVIVADEPTTGQDAITRGELVETLRGLGVTLVLLSHDLDVVRALADEIVVLRDGQITESGRTVLDAPRGDYARALVSAQPDPAAPLTARSLPEAPRLRICDLTAAYRGRTAVHQVSLDVAEGERLGVVGRSGSGKTTLARCVAGLHPWTGGGVAVDGVPLPSRPRRRTREHRTLVQYVFQDARASFDPWRPVDEQVARTAVRLRDAPPGQARAEALESLERMGLDASVARHRPHRLSGGELQRAALARALLARPRVLICDEITSGLDTLTQATILDLLAELDLTLVFISHDLGVVARIADRVAVVHEGRVVEHGPAGQVLRSPGHPLTKALLGDHPTRTGVTT
ncbi:ABC transporter ATP-binding protein [Actinomadura viridis]|uniref:Peptide/nickel transport system ATP-binding protein n=1 Tax=Actinomadura viridis TaxID=58110 RepID=A0A931DFX8_9ACTN|nr:ATP-binding cassette domain-containing protein [Actinomadura viridis]MBG6086033.1 peptide/nickel transport system ATP-binding protein [Actinomadura viridis]